MAKATWRWRMAAFGQDQGVVERHGIAGTENSAQTHQG